MTPITPTKTEPTGAEWRNLIAVAENRARKAAEEARDLRDEVRHLQEAVDDRTAQLDQMAGERNRLQNRIASLTTRLRDTQDANRQLRRETDAPTSDAATAREAAAEGRFTDPEQQLRWEIYLAWVMRIDPAAKADHPLPEAYDIGPDFISSLETLQGVDRGKVMDVIVEVLTGFATDLSGRKIHQLRESGGGGTETRRRADGAIAWRVALQRGAPAARALHFWRKPNSRIELGQVGVHDDDLR